MAAICTPTTGVRGRGKIDMTYDRQETAQTTTPYGVRTNTSDIYTFEATPAAGWKFLRFDIYQSYDYGRYIETERETHETITSSSSWPDNNPLTTTSYLPGFYLPSIGEWFGTSSTRAYRKTLTYHVVAVFARTTAYTHLLINSSTVESPVQLVFDPATNLLVADY
ncbi:MAG: hypothetical protein IJQ54_03615 [Kiritimatiellae bacterium]|nr:hypothetical protein [Kiritimatiellia bacterium]